MSESATLIDRTIARELAPRLREAGLQKRARNFRRAAGCSLQILNVQGSAWNFPDRAQFTVNVAVHFPSVVAAMAEPIPAAAPPEHACHLRSRIGSLSPDRRDLWWEVTCDADIETVGHELAVSVFAYAMPWLNGLVEFGRCAEFCEAHGLFSYACVLFHGAGERGRAELALGRALQQHDPCIPRDVLRDWGRDVGLAQRLMMV